MWLQISAGTGPVESCRFVYLFLNLVRKECKCRNLKLQILNFNLGEEKSTLKSVFLKIDGKEALTYIKSIEGTHLLIWRSEYRKNHKRKNWFISVSSFNYEDNNDLNSNDIIIEKMRSSGKGGQHVNKTETAVRITHKKTGIVVSSSEERSQFLNIKLAKSRLLLELKKLSNEREKRRQSERWVTGTAIVRGNPIKTYNYKELDY
ncbi:peptide chain release factor H [Clostridium felsineum]|uniref:peptide chain release factor H n=1 Tax=Clostridium felsineum TaxID=36839 RepID=UPI00214DDFE3|nr:peptide chain release factor H [Clostridium felsineum]MCR3757559.1 peptide chain release factor H [Clostridium felsineum]